MKAVYSGLIAGRDDWEVAETFFNSVTRRIFTTVGVDHQIEFVATDFETPPTRPQSPVYRVYNRVVALPELITSLVKDFRLAVPFRDLAGDAQLVAARIEDQMAALNTLRTVERVEMIKPAFYRGMGAYLVGRLFSGSQSIPLALSLIHI